MNANISNSRNARRMRNLIPAGKVKRQQQNIKNYNNRIAVPAALGRVVKTQQPRVSGSRFTNDGRTTVRHREYISDISGSVAYAVSSFSINPGLSSSFPWANIIGLDYESYLFSELSFEFESSKSSSTSGSVMMAVDYDASDAAPASKIQLMAYHDSVRSNVWAECEFICDKDDLQKFGKQRFLRYGSLSANQDIKTYDVGNLFVATQGCADTSVIGELYVTYSVTFMTPQLSTAAMINAFSAKIVSTTAISRTAALGSAPVITGGLPISAVTNTITFNRVGTYLLDILVVGTVFAAGPALSGTATAATQYAIANGGATSESDLILVTVTAIGQTVIVDYSGACTTLTGGDWRIAPYDVSLA